MTEESFGVNPLPLKPDFIEPPVLPDVAKQEPLGSGFVTRVLGQGGMANVYEIWVPQLEVHRAVKLIKPESSKDIKDRFQTEIRILAKLTHPNIIDIHSVGEWKGMPYIEMEKLDGWTLESIINRFGALPPKICSAIGILVCRALAFAHAHEYVIYGKEYKGIIHRDLKPGNIMICRDGKLKLMDFGIARPVDASFHTIEGTILGTIQYMSPELLNGEKIDFRTDIYALGATLYEILAGMNPFPEPNFSKLISLKQKNLYRPLHEFKIRIPSKLRHLIYTCMQYDKKKRIDSTDKLLYEIEILHRQLTPQLPELVLKELCKEEPAQKFVPAIGRTIPWKSIFGIPVLVILIAAALYRGLPFLKSKIITVVEQQSSSPAEPEQKNETAQSAVPIQPGTGEQQPVEQDVLPAETTALEKAVAVQNRPILKRPVKTAENCPKEQSDADASSASSLLSRLSERYATSDVLEIIINEYNTGHLANALNLYNHLGPEQAAKDKAKIYKMRILQGLGNTKALSAFFAANNVNDGEFLLGKGKFAYNRGEISKAVLLLQNSLNAPKQFIDYDIVRQEAYYYKARCASKMFDKNPTEENYLKALEEWRNLGALFTNNKTHTLFLEYRHETQRIGEKYRGQQK